MYRKQQTKKRNAQNTGKENEIPNEKAIAEYTVLGTVPWIPGNLDFFFPLNQVSHLGVTNLVAPCV